MYPENRKASGRLCWEHVKEVDSMEKENTYLPAQLNELEFMGRVWASIPKELRGSVRKEIMAYIRGFASGVQSAQNLPSST